MRHDLDILRLALKHLIRIRTRPHHIRPRRRPAHLLLRHLARCVVAAEEVDEDGLQAEEADEVQRDGGHPAGVEVACCYACLQHLFELWGDGEGEFHWGVLVWLLLWFMGGGGRTNDESAEKGVDPPHDESLRHDHSHVPLHHPHHALHSRGVRHWVRRRLALSVGVLKVGARLEGGDEGVLAGLEGGVGDDGCILAERDAALEGALLAQRGEVEFLWRRGDEDCDVVA